MKHYLLLLTAVLAASFLQAQNIKRETMQVEYISRPSEPIPSDVVNYEVVVNQVYKGIYEDELAQWEIDLF